MKTIGTFWKYQGNIVRIMGINFGLVWVKVWDEDTRPFLVGMDQLTGGPIDATTL